MIGRTNTGGGGGGGLSPNSAVIHVTAPVGSTISFSKGGVVAKVLGPEKSHVNAYYNTIADWYYSVSSSNYGSWTVTATLDTDEASSPVTVSSNKQYDVVLGYHYFLYNRGNQYTDLTGGYYATGSTITIESNKIHFTGGGGYVLWSQNQISRGDFTKLFVKIENESFGTTTNSGLAIGFYRNRDIGSQTPFTRVKQGGEQSLDISSVTNARYIILYVSVTGEYCDVTQIWLE